MTDLRTFWFNKNTAKTYNKQIHLAAPGIFDETTIAQLINIYLPNKGKLIIDLGIGPGRELPWLDKLYGIEKIIGLDFSSAMLKVCSENVKICTHEIVLVKDNLLKLKTLPKIVACEKRPIIYLSLINSFGNFTSTERLVVLKNIREILKQDDRIILALFKRSQQGKLESLTKKALYLKTENPNDQHLLTEIISYGSITLWWDSVIEKYKRLPTFWYDKKTNDIVIHVNGKRLWISHRFIKEEIEEEFQKAGLKIDQLIEGKAMYIVVGKKLV